MIECPYQDKHARNQIGQTNQGDNDESFSEAILRIHRDGCLSHRKYDRPEDREHKRAWTDTERRSDQYISSDSGATSKTERGEPCKPDRSKEQYGLSS